MFLGMAIKGFDPRIAPAPKNNDIAPKGPATSQPQGEVKKGGSWLEGGKGGGTAPLSDVEKAALQAQTAKDTLSSLVTRLQSQPQGTPLRTMERTSMEYLVRAYEVTHPKLVEESGVRQLLQANDAQSVSI